MKILSVCSAAAMAVALLSATPASAQWRHGWHGGGGWHHHHHRWGGAGAGVGLATGLIAGAAIASASRANDHEAYCMQRYRSYDPASGTFLGNDGRRHPC